MTISGERTEQLDIFSRVTGFTGDFLSFIHVELIRFFHGALQSLRQFDWSFARFIAPDVTTTSIIVSSNKTSYPRFTWKNGQKRGENHWTCYFCKEAVDSV